MSHQESLIEASKIISGIHERNKQTTSYYGDLADRLKAAAEQFAAADRVADKYSGAMAGLAAGDSHE